MARAGRQADVARAGRQADAARTGRASEQQQERLNTPGRRKRSALPTLKLDRDAFGQFAEGFARFMGTARFLLGMTVVIVVWVLWNVPFSPVPVDLRFDEYPFIFLTLVLSLQASYAAPLILLAQNRQESRDRVGLDSDREQAAQSRADMDFLAREVASLRMSVGELATRDYIRSELRSELRAILDELDADEPEPDGRREHDGRRDGAGSPRGQSSRGEAGHRPDAGRNR